MNIHEHQAKEILKEYGAPISEGVVIHSLNDLGEKIKKLKEKICFKSTNPRRRERKSWWSKID